MSTSDTQESTYIAYMLRLWRADVRAPWRASLQSTVTEKTYHFTDVDQMWAHLKAQMEGAIGTGPAGARGSRELPEGDAA
jgi:hypothetical protein